LPAARFKKSILEKGVNRMKSRFFLLLGALSLMLVGCDRNTTPKPDADNTQTTNDTDDDNNTSFNAQDADRQIADRIHQTLEDDNTLSNDAKNIKVIVLNGDVTLRGLVRNPQEKSIILIKVQQIPDVNNINDRLEINR
jgi:hyperosmotically inducible periplasmic protein